MVSAWTTRETALLPASPHALHSALLHFASRSCILPRALFALRDPLAR